ncbi:MAG: DnaA N-terminal domain-containing protein, partial [Lachnospiraceae bacterium]
MNIVIEKWDEIIKKLKMEHNLSDVSFKTWIVPLKVYDVINNTVFILVNLKGSIDYIEQKYLLPFQVCIAEVTGTEYEVKFILDNESNLAELRTLSDSSKGPKKKSNAIEKANLNSKYTFDTFVVGSNN